MIQFVWFKAEVYLIRTNIYLVQRYFVWIKQILFHLNIKKVFQTNNFFDSIKCFFWVQTKRVIHVHLFDQWNPTESNLQSKFPDDYLYYRVTENQCNITYRASSSLSYEIASNVANLQHAHQFYGGVNEVQCSW